MRKFKGTLNEYVSLHNWVRRYRGKPRKCEDCETTESRFFDWANISGEYKMDLTDWARLCRKCHRARDISDKCKSKGHSRKDEDMYINPDGDRACKLCKYEYDRKYRKEHSEEIKLQVKQRIEKTGITQGQRTQAYHKKYFKEYYMKHKVTSQSF